MLTQQSCMLPMTVLAMWDIRSKIRGIEHVEIFVRSEVKNEKMGRA